jgi:hypothetical protein
MPTQFSGAAQPLDNDGFLQVLDALEIQAPDLWSLLTVEARGCGFLADRQPMILFERHIFSQLTGGKFDAANPDVSNPVAGGYGTTGVAQYQRLGNAMALDPGAALQSASWGIAQIMGENYAVAGYTSVNQMIDVTCSGENAQLVGLARFLQSSKLDVPLRRHDWTSLARGYNGPGYAKNNYDTRLAGAYARFALGQLPDLTVRAAQVYLSYLGYDPGPVDGQMGRFTRSAMNDFQTHQGLASTDEVDSATFAALKEQASPPLTA